MSVCCSLYYNQCTIACHISKRKKCQRPKLCSHIHNPFKHRENGRAKDNNAIAYFLIVVCKRLLSISSHVKVTLLCCRAEEKKLERTQSPNQFIRSFNTCTQPEFERNFKVEYTGCRMHMVRYDMGQSVM